MVISLPRALRVGACSYFVSGLGLLACSANEDTFSGQTDGPAEDSEAKIPVNIAGSGFVSCGILDRPELFPSALLVCNSSQAEFRGLHLLDAASNNVTKKTQTFRSSTFGQVLFSELSQIDKTYVADRAVLEIEKDSTSYRFELRLLQATQPIQELLQKEVSETYKNSAGSALTSQPLNPACDEARKSGSLQTLTRSITIQKRSDSCLWKKMPQKNLAEGLFTAEFRSGMDIEVPDRKIICQAKLKSDEKPFNYNDEFALVANDRIIAASFGGKQEFSNVQFGFPLYDWSELAGQPMKVGGDIPACYGLSPSRVCSLPSQNLGGKMAFEIDLPLAELQYRPRKLRFDVATFGDNDSDQSAKLIALHEDDHGSAAGDLESVTEIDCTHSELKVEVFMQLADLKE